MTRKTVLVIANATNVHTHRWLREFMRRGWDVKVVSAQPPNTKNLEEFGSLIVPLPTYFIYRWLIRLPFFRYSEFHNINSGVRKYEPYSISTIFNYAYLLFFIKRIVRRIQPTGIFSIYLTMGGFLAARSGHPRSVACLAGGEAAHAYRKTHLAYWLNYPGILRFAVDKAFRVIAGDRTLYLPHFQRYECRTDHIDWMSHWGVDTERFVPAPRKSNVCTFVCARPYREKFDFHSILSAIVEVHKHHPEIRLIIASGAQSEENIRALKSIMQETGCDELGITDILHHVEYSEFHELLQRCDIYIDPVNIHKHPETADWGVSASLLESMACGVIPVVSRRPATDWVLPPEVEPFRYERMETELATALIRALQSRHDPKLRQAVRESIISRANWKTNFSLIEGYLDDGSKS